MKINLQKADSKSVFVPAVARRLGGAVHPQINTSPLRRTLRFTPSSSSANRKIRLQLSPVASYSADTYGPVGGDARIKVIGVGGGGGNAVNRMISSGLQVRLICVFIKGGETDMVIIFSLLRCTTCATTDAKMNQHRKNIVTGCRVLGGQHRCPGLGKPPSHEQTSNRNNVDQRSRDGG